MKSFVTRFILAAVTLCVATSAHAQFADVTGGSMMINLSPELLAITHAQNVYAAVYTQAPFDYQIPFLGVTSGVFNLTTGAGAMGASGIFVLSNATNTVTVQELAFETVGAKPVITATVYLNNHFMMHGPVMQIMTANPLGAPLHVGPLMLQGIPLQLTPGMIQVFAGVFSVAVPPQTSAGTLSMNTGLSGV